MEIHLSLRESSIILLSLKKEKGKKVQCFPYLSQHIFFFLTAKEPTPNQVINITKSM